MLPEKLHFSPLSRRLVEASFTGGHITSDAGLLLLREVDRQHGLTRRLAKIVPDRRDPGRVQHGLQSYQKNSTFPPSLAASSRPLSPVVTSPRMRACCCCARSTGNMA
ncbi:hypothetical protein IPC1518_09015 [Pseudomonas aeruginosa]|nr:hypothetical protein IPC1518_09015 [Pseudomonas aeruginosa]